MFYYRRKILLALLEVFDLPLTAIQLQKYLFLFTRSQTIKSFDFIPYKYGCFSFQANQDIAVMRNSGLLEEIDCDGNKSIHIKDTSGYLPMLDMFDQQALRDVKDKFGNLSQDELIHYIYVNFPFYATKSTIASSILTVEELAVVERQKHHYEIAQLFTIGYEGISLEEYIKRLIINDVHVLCDVRKNAYSQKYGFSKAQLQKACEGVGIKYVHVPQLGIESDKRQDLRSQKDYDILFKEYERTTLKNNMEALMYVRSLIDADKRVALTCFEKDPKQCHRLRVANALMALPDNHYHFSNLL